jgi:hypothetical protein
MSCALKKTKDEKDRNIANRLFGNGVCANFGSAIGRQCDRTRRHHS